MSLKVYSQNVRGMRDFIKRRKVFTYFKKKNCNILCLQETFSDPTDEKYWRSEWGSKILFSHGERNSKGVAILFSHEIDVEILDVSKDCQGRFLICTIKKGSRIFVISNVY